MYLTDDIIDVEGIEIESIPIHEGDEVEMGSNNAEEMRNEGGWTKAPDTKPTEKGVKQKKTEVKVEKVEDIKDDSWLLRNGPKIAGVGIVLALLTAAWNKDKITDWFKDFGNDLTKSNTEDEQLVEPDYDTALASTGATLDEQEPQVIEEGAYDEVIGGQVLAFTDPYDDDQVYARASYNNIYLQKSNVMDVTNEELSDQIKFVNGTYNAESDDEAWDMFNETARTFSLLRTASAQSFHFTGGLVDNNGVHIALGYDAWLPDNTKNSDFMEKSSILFQNLLTATTMEEMMDASKMFLKLEADLKEGVLETPNGTKLDCNSLTDAEFYIFYQEVQTANLIIYNTLREDATITYTDNIGQEVKVTLKTLDHYYNPQCDYEDEEYDHVDITESKFAK